MLTSPPSSNERAIGLAVYAAYGFEAASAGPERFLPIQWRHKLMSALVQRGVLDDYKHGEELDEKVFRAAATIPCDKNDLAEAMLPRLLTPDLCTDSELIGSD